MRRWETLTALAAVVLASLGGIARLPFHATLTIFAVVLIVVVGISRLIETFGRKSASSSDFDAAERARLIRERRDKRR